MNAEIKTRWIELLESGQYEKGQMCLRDDKNKYCCLGVLTDLYHKETGLGQWNDQLELLRIPFVMEDSSEKSYLLSPIANWAGLSIDEELDLAGINDENSTFGPVIEKIKTL